MQAAIRRRRDNDGENEDNDENEQDDDDESVRLIIDDRDEDFMMFEGDAGGVEL
jgi:hypothetical protein